MYIAQTFKNLHDWWRYVIGLIVAFIGVGVFSIPHFVGIFMKRMEGTVDLTRLDDVNYLMSLFDSNINLVFVLLPFAGGLIFLLIIVKLLHKQSIRSLTTARKKIDWKRIWFAFFFWGIISSGMTLLDYFLSPESYLDNFELNRFLILAVIAIILIPFQTSFEEYLFRGYLMQGIGVVAKNKWVPLIITSLIFGLLHIANPEVDKLGYSIMVYYIGTGLFLGIITLMDEGMELALGFHAANNLFTALLVTANWTALQTHSIFKDTAEPEAGFANLILPVFIIFPILLFIFSRVYKWTNWKEKLTGKVVEPPKENYKIID
ncbi:CPBP family intramembrane glutamic endopeptidase [uncultured Lacinutrix sp.]|uniref:CPBP family intramembrane glutamic endopeptidase n=1 Tax=uncultured Lacinutrix sp. TaxID=574032 RepID=UPI002601AB08|nr:type II CAAX endopeptidase family protein [uncultured Lacinutrix sp.]